MYCIIYNEGLIMLWLLLTTWYCKAQCMDVCYIEAWVCYNYNQIMYPMTYHTNNTTAWLNGNSSATLWYYLHVPNTSHHYTISFPYCQLLWLQGTGWCELTDGKVCSMCLTTHSIYEPKQKSLCFITLGASVKLW